MLRKLHAKRKYSKIEFYNLIFEINSSLHFRNIIRNLFFLFATPLLHCHNQLVESCSLNCSPEKSLPDYTKAIFICTSYIKHNITTEFRRKLVKILRSFESFSVLKLNKNGRGENSVALPRELRLFCGLPTRYSYVNLQFLCLITWYIITNI